MANTNGTDDPIDGVPSPEPPIDTTNKFLLASGLTQGSVLTVTFLRPCPQVIGEADALLLAAYLVSLVGDDEQWVKVLAAVQNA